jgi:hypothetical protein
LRSRGPRLRSTGRSGARVVKSSAPRPDSHSSRVQSTRLEPKRPQGSNAWSEAEDHRGAGSRLTDRVRLTGGTDRYAARSMQRSSSTGVARQSPEHRRVRSQRHARSEGAITVFHKQGMPLCSDIMCIIGNKPSSVRASPTAPVRWGDGPFGLTHIVRRSTRPTRRRGGAWLS